MNYNKLTISKQKYNNNKKIEINHIKQTTEINTWL